MPLRRCHRDLAPVDGWLPVLRIHHLHDVDAVGRHERHPAVEVARPDEVGLVQIADPVGRRRPGKYPSAGPQPKALPSLDLRLADPFGNGADPGLMPLNRTPIAAGCTLAAVAVAVAAVALSAGGGEPSPSAPAAAPTPEVRTEIIRRTVHVRRKRPAPAATGSAGSSVRAVAPAAAARATAAAPRIASPSRADNDRSGHDNDDDNGGHGQGDD